mmetsp:Transcript_30460/g.69743  ORF Transcript_30460/g.69743 Transcript_30460/m.69743 type:complete len:211 (+) Transcript_30460:319-951(+)
MGRGEMVEQLVPRVFLLRRGPRLDLFLRLGPPRLEIQLLPFLDGQELHEMVSGVNDHPVVTVVPLRALGGAHHALVFQPAGAEVVHRRVGHRAQVGAGEARREDHGFGEGVRTVCEGDRADVGSAQIGEAGNDFFGGEADVRYGRDFAGRQIGRGGGVRRRGGRHLSGREPVVEVVVRRMRGRRWDPSPGRKNFTVAIPRFRYVNTTIIF